MGKFMTPEDATLAGKYSEWIEEEEESETLFDFCVECNGIVYDDYCEECEEYID